MHEPLTEEDMAMFARLREEAKAPPDTEHNAECACEACDAVVEAGWKARGALEALRDLDAVGRLLAEVQRLRAEQAADRAVGSGLVCHSRKTGLHSGGGSGKRESCSGALGFGRQDRRSSCTGPSGGAS